MPHGIEEWPAAVECRFWPSRDDEELAFAEKVASLYPRQILGGRLSSGGRLSFDVKIAMKLPGLDRVAKHVSLPKGRIAWAWLSRLDGELRVISASVSDLH